MNADHFEIVGRVNSVETIAVSGSIRELENLRELFGKGRWRKLKGVATIRFRTGQTWTAELHWCEAHGVGKRKMKIKRLIKRLS